MYKREARCLEQKGSKVMGWRSNTRTELRLWWNSAIMWITHIYITNASVRVRMNILTGIKYKNLLPWVRKCPTHSVINMLFKRLVELRLYWWQENQSARDLQFTYTRTSNLKWILTIFWNVNNINHMIKHERNHRIHQVHWYSMISLQNDLISCRTTSWAGFCVLPWP